MPLVGKRRQIDEESNDRLDQSYTDRSDVYDGESDPPSAPPVGGPQQLPTSKVWNQLAVVAGVFSVVLFLHQRGAVFPRESRISLRYAASQQTGRAAASEPSLTDAPKPSFVLPPRIDEVVLPDSIGGGGLRKAGLQITSWNLATPGNPFEYHFGGDAPGDAVLKQFSTALLGLQDTVEAVFTPDMFTELKNTMSRVYTLQPCLDNKWETYKGMKVAEFLQRIEEKGVIKSIDAKTNPFLQLRVDAEHRPTPAGCGAVPEGGVAEWWKKWHTFMFDTEATSNKGSGNIFGLVRESSCLGVDVLALGVFDAIMVHTFEKTQGWREVKEALCETLHGANAAKKIIAGLREHHASSDIVMLQNVDAKLLEAIREDEFGKSFSIKSPSRFENDRKHNSVVLFRTGRFLGITEVTGDIHFGSLSHSDLGGKIAVFTATRLDREATKMIIASVSGSHTLIDSIHDYTVTHSPIRSLFAALFRVESDADKALSFAPNRHLSVVSGKSWTRFYSKTHAQKDFSLGVAPSEKNSGTKVVTEYLISPGGMKASEDVQTTVLGQEGTVLPTTAHPAVSAAITCLYSHIEPILTEKKLQEQYSGLIKEIVAKLMTFTPTGVPTEVPSTGVPVVGGEASTYEETIPTTAPVQMMELNGSIILPPEGVRDYVGVEKGELWPKASQVPGAMTVTAVCDNGLGDRLGSLYSAIHLAWTLNAKFHIIWNMNNECRARVSTLFEWDGSSSSVANKSAGDNLEMRLQGQGQAYDAVITLKHHFSTGSLVNFDNGSPTPPVGDEPWLCGESRKVNLAPDGQIVQWALARQKRGLRTHILHHIDRLAQGTDLAGVAKAMKHYNFKINPVIIDRVDRFCLSHQIDPKNTVGIHLRGTDARIPLRMKDVITDVRIRFSGRTFFVASDDEKAERQFLEEFRGRAVKNTLKTHYPGKLDKNSDFRIQGKLGAGRFNVERDEPSVVDALTDMALLSRTERPIIDGVLRDSSFGKMSTTLCVLRVTCNEELAKIAETVKAPARPGG